MGEVDQNTMVRGDIWANNWSVRHWQVTEFSNCFILWLPSWSLFSSFDHSLTTQGSDLPFFTQEHSYNIITHEQNIICSKTHIDGTAYEQTSRPLFLGYMVGFWPMEREKKMKIWMILKLLLVGQLIGISWQMKWVC